MTIRRKLIASTTISLIVVSLLAGILLAGLHSNQEENNLFAYPLSVGDQTFNVTVETNWSEERPPSVTLLNSSDTRYPIELYFLGGTKEKTIFYNITIPTDLLWGNISLIRKYFVVDPENYTLINNGTHNILQMTFDYQPFFSGNGYFEILGTEGVW